MHDNISRVQLFLLRTLRHHLSQRKQKKKPKRRVKVAFWWLPASTQRAKLPPCAKQIAHVPLSSSLSPPPLPLSVTLSLRLPLLPFHSPHSASLFFTFISRHLTPDHSKQINLTRVFTVRKKIEYVYKVPLPTFIIQPGT